MIPDATKIVGANGNRHPLDFYPTPPEVTHALINFLEARELLTPGSTVWEPACGDGAMAKVFDARGYNTICTDIKDGVDFITADHDGLYTWIITNPPFNKSVQFIEHALDLECAFAFLLKSQYWHSAKRLSLFEKCPPTYVLPLTWRPDFTGEGSSLMDMMWCVWIPWIGITRYIPLKKPKEG